MHCNVHLLHIPKQKQVGILLLLHFETSGSCLQSIYSLVCIKYIYTKLFSWFSIVRDEQKFFISRTQVIRTISVFFFKINDFFLMTSKQSYQAKNPTTFPRRLDSWGFFFQVPNWSMFSRLNFISDFLPVFQDPKCSTIKEYFHNIEHLAQLFYRCHKEIHTLNSIQEGTLLQQQGIII